MKKSFLLLATSFLIFGATPAHADESNVVDDLQVKKPIERSSDLQYFHRGRRATNWEVRRRTKARHMLPRRMRNSQNTIQWARKERAGADDVLAPGKDINYSLHWKNRRFKVGQEYKSEYHNMYRKPELQANRKVRRARRYNRPAANTLNSNRSGQEKLYKLYYGQ